MAKRWTPKRAARCRRRADGTFREWTGGKTKAELKKKENTAHGIRVHIGKEFVRQHGRTARVGECVRFKTKDGTYHEQADWYVRTPHGWRDTGSNRKPTRTQIKRICDRARPSRPRRR